VQALYSYDLEEKNSILSMKYGSAQQYSHITNLNHKSHHSYIGSMNLVGSFNHKRHHSYIGSGNMVYSKTYSKASSHFNVKKYTSRQQNKHSTRQYSQKQSQKYSQNLFSIMVQPHRIPEPLFHFPTNKPTITEPVPNLPYDMDDILDQSDV